MKKTLLLCLMTCFISEVSFISADIIEDAKDKLKQTKEAVANAKQKGEDLLEGAKEKVEETFDEITGSTKNKVRDHVIAHVENTEEFKQSLKKSKNLLSQIKVKKCIVQGSISAVKEHCIKTQNKRKIKCKECLKGIWEAHKHLVDQIKEAQKPQ